MIPYRISPYLTFIENRLYPGVIQHALFHRLTGEVLMPGERLSALLLAMQTSTDRALIEDRLRALEGEAAHLPQLVRATFLIPEKSDPLVVHLDHYVVRPMQNPALIYRNETGGFVLVRTSMAERLYSPKRDQLPVVTEEKLPEIAGRLFGLADGGRTLRQLADDLGFENPEGFLCDSGVREAIDFLTTAERQLIKFTADVNDVIEPFKACNTVPRNFYHAARWSESADKESNSIIDFHRHGIEDASWEFDLIEATVNHAFRFPSEALGGLNYGSRFCLNTLQPAVVPLLQNAKQLEVLEVGGGTGSFARSFLEQASRLRTSVLKGVDLHYQILDLSPALIASQKELLAQVAPDVQHFQQDATTFEIPGRVFDLIISNEVIADFPVARVERRAGAEGEPDLWEGEGASYVRKYELFDATAPQSFLVNAGVFKFIERAWQHLAPGGTLIMSEYGSETRYPVQAFHLNHEEFSIHFGHIMACGKKIGFDCRVLKLTDFLQMNDEVPVLGGQEEQILCLNRVLKKYGMSVPYAVLSESELEQQIPDELKKADLTGLSYLALKKGFHFGPPLADFFLAIMRKPD